MARRRWVLLTGAVVIALAVVLVVASSLNRHGGKQTAANTTPSLTPIVSSATPTLTTATPTPTKTRTPTKTPSPTRTTVAPSSSAPPSSSSAPVVVHAPTPTPTPTPTQVGTYPQWLPFHNTMKVGCVKNNCENNYHGYWAIDFETLDNKPGAPVYAAGAGRVRIASQGSGNCGGPGTIENALIVDHGNGIESVYVHLHDFAVAPGTWVTPNTVIGHVGTSGYTDPCPDYHLHYEVRINGASVNPGALKACHGSTLVTYPYAIGYSDWNQIPPQEYAGGKLDPKGRTLYSNGTGCGG